MLLFQRGSGSVAKRVLLIILCTLFILKPEGHAQKIRFTGTDNGWMAVHTNYVDGTTSRQVGYFYPDTSIVLHGVAYKALSNEKQIQLLVREDTATGKVYFRSWSGFKSWWEGGIGNGAYLVDTAEFVAYDYGLNIGDTLIMPLVYYGYGATSMHILTEKDSVKINGIWHIAQRFTCPFGFGQAGGRGYDVVEGVGSLTNPVNPTPTINFENTFNLACFSNGDTLSPSEVRLSFPLIASWGWFRLASFSSCRKLDIAERTLPGVVWKMSPNPAREEVIVDLEPHSAEVYDLYIHDVLGKVLYAGRVKRQLRIPLSSWAPGYYLVTLSDAKGRRSIQKLAVQ